MILRRLQRLQKSVVDFIYSEILSDSDDKKVVISTKTNNQEHL